MIDITVTLATRGRYITTLPLCLMSILNQSLKPKRIILVDDNDEKDFYKIDILKDILILLKLKNIEFEYYHGQSKGQTYAQQIALSHVNTEWIFKTDDDNVIEPNVFETLSHHITDRVGALSGLILSKKDFNTNRSIEYTAKIYNKIKDIYRYFNVQMCKNQDDTLKRVEHIYSNYLFRRKLIDRYPLEFAPAGHREDTVTTHAIHRKGYQLFVDPNAIIWHLNECDGGNRNYDYSLTVKNEILFLEKLKEWKIYIDIKEDKNKVYEIKDGKEWLIYEKNR